MLIIALFWKIRLYFHVGDIVSSMSQMTHFGFVYCNETWHRDSICPKVTNKIAAHLEVTSRSLQGHPKVTDVLENVVLKKGCLAEIGHL